MNSVGVWVCTSVGVRLSGRVAECVHVHGESCGYNFLGSERVIVSLN